LRVGPSTVDLRQQSNGQAQEIDGDPAAVAEYAVWWRGQVAAEEPLILYDEGYNTVVELIPGMHAPDVLAKMAE
jgi:hypothetical protein